MSKKACLSQTQTLGTISQYVWVTESGWLTGFFRNVKVNLKNKLFMGPLEEDVAYLSEWFIEDGKEGSSPPISQSISSFNNDQLDINLSFDNKNLWTLISLVWLTNDNKF